MCFYKPFLHAKIGHSTKNDIHPDTPQNYVISCFNSQYCYHQLCWISLNNSHPGFTKLFSSSNNYLASTSQAILPNIIMQTRKRTSFAERRTRHNQGIWRCVESNHFTLLVKSSVSLVSLPLLPNNLEYTQKQKYERYNKCYLWWKLNYINLSGSKVDLMTLLLLVVFSY